MTYDLDPPSKPAMTFVAACDCGCWRGIATTRLQALERLAHHERDAHPTDRTARAALARAKAKAARA